MLGRRVKDSKGRVRKVRLERWERGGLPAIEALPDELVVVEEALLLCFWRVGSGMLLPPELVVPALVLVLCPSTTKAPSDGLVGFGNRLLTSSKAESRSSSSRSMTMTSGSRGPFRRPATPALLTCCFSSCSCSFAHSLSFSLVLTRRPNRHFRLPLALLNPLNKLPPLDPSSSFSSCEGARAYCTRSSSPSVSSSSPAVRE